jgi:hypothetical protein
MTCWRLKRPLNGSEFLWIIFTGITLAFPLLAGWAARFGSPVSEGITPSVSGENSMANVVKPKDTENLARATMRLPQSLWDDVRHRAIDERCSVSELVARALYEYLKKGGRE